MQLSKNQKQQLVGRLVAKTYKLFGIDIWVKIPDINERLKFYKKLFSIKEERKGVAFCNAELREILYSKFTEEKQETL